MTRYAVVVRCYMDLETEDPVEAHRNIRRALEQHFGARHLRKGPGVGVMKVGPHEPHGVEANLPEDMKGGGSSITRSSSRYCY